MKIISLDIERFGLWSDLHLTKLEGGLNVFYGPNEAGKTTLMDFVRTILYGLHEERLRYAFPYSLDRKYAKNAQNESPEAEHEHPQRRKKEKWISGGSLTVASPDGRFHVQRFFDPHDLQLGSDDGLSITSERAIHQDSAILRTILSGIDEQTFNNVFTFGLDELRKLGTLDDTAAAEMLFRLSIGLDRVSLVDVLRSLSRSRTDMIDPSGKETGLLQQMLYKRTKITEELGQSRSQLWEYTRILTEQRKLDRVISQIQEELVALRYQQRLNELAIATGPIWDQRENVRTEIQDRNNPPAVSEEDLMEVEDVEERVGKKRETLQGLRERYVGYKKQIAETPVNETLWKLAPRIEIILEEETRIIELDQQITELENEASTLELELQEHEKHLRYGRRKTAPRTGDKDYHPPQGAAAFANGESENDLLNAASAQRSEHSPNSHSGNAKENNDGANAARAAYTGRTMQHQPSPEPLRNLEEFRVYSRQVKRTRRRYSHYKKSCEELTERLKVLVETVKSEMSKRNTADLHEALEHTSEMVTQLRRRQGIAQKLDEMNRHRQELDRQNLFLVQNQGVPAWALAMLIGGAMVSVMLIVATVFNPEAVHPAFGVLGIFVVVAGWLAKTFLERQNSQKLDYNQRQLSLLITQLDQAKQDAAAIDARYPAAGMSHELRYQTAQKDLASLEKLIPVDAQRKEIAHRIKAEEERLIRAKDAAQQAQKRWIEWLASTGLPTDWTPQQIRDLLGRYGNAGEIRRNLERAYEDINQRVRDLRVITDRIDRVVLETNLAFADGMSYVEVLDRIRKELLASEEGAKRRIALAEELKKLKPQRRKILERIAQLKSRRLEILRKYDVKSKEELLHASELHHEYLLLLEQENAVQRELDAAVGNFCTEEVLAAQLEAEKRKTLETQKEQISRRIETTEAQLREETEKHGRFGLELQQLAADRSALKKRRELTLLNRNIRDSVHRWQVEAVSCRILEDIRKAYERERQPLALAETSDYFRRLTSGRYQRVWTPLGEDTLKIDDAEGNTLDVSWLSRGTREQLFISLRLALSASFARHGSDLPLILDDVMVNFDTRRARAAAKVLEEFAESGKQIILFTCHEHISRIFQQMDVPVRILPRFEEKKKTIRVLLPISVLRERREKGRIESEEEVPTEEIATEEITSEPIPFVETAEEETNSLPLWPEIKEHPKIESLEDQNDEDEEEEEPENGDEPEEDDENDPFVQEFFLNPDSEEPQEEPTGEDEDFDYDETIEEEY